MITKLTQALIATLTLISHVLTSQAMGQEGKAGVPQVDHSSSFDTDSRNDAILKSSSQTEETNHASRLVENFTAYTLAQGEIKLGTELEYGLIENIMIGTETLSILAGIPSVTGKWQAWKQSRHTIALGLQAAWLTLDTLVPWARAKDHYKTLDGVMVRPALNWTNRVSGRLTLHTYWTVGLGSIDAELSEYGKRKSWEQKHPGGDYENQEPNSRSEDTDPSSVNQEKMSVETSNVTRRTLELQSLFGLSTDRFQITGEFLRDSGAKVLITSRIEKMSLGKLRANSFRLTIAQHWVSSVFQFRLGVGAMYLSITGYDLDEERVDETGFSPVSDIAFYWRF